MLKHTKSEQNARKIHEAVSPNLMSRKPKAYENFFSFKILLLLFKFSNKTLLEIFQVLNEKQIDNHTNHLSNSSN